MIYLNFLRNFPKKKELSPSEENHLPRVPEKYPNIIHLFKINIYE